MICCLIIFILTSPFLPLLGPTQLRDYMYRELAYKVIVENLVSESDTDVEKSLKIQNWVFQTEYPVDRFEIIDGSALLDFLKGVGFCDKLSKGVINLTKKLNIDGRVTSLYGSYKVSHHTVAELEIDGKYKVFDPFFNTTFYKADNKLASFSDLQNGDVRYAVNERAYRIIDIEPTYFKYYHDKYPPRLLAGSHSRNWLKVALSKLVDFYYDGFGNYFLLSFEKVYFMLDGAGLLTKARMKRLTFRYDEAISDYTKLLKSGTNVFTQKERVFWRTNQGGLPSKDIFRYFRAKAYFDLKDYKTCVKEFSKLLERFSATVWKKPAKEFLDYCERKSVSI